MIPARAGEWRAAISTLTHYRAAEQMRSPDGWMLVQFDRETRGARRVFGFVLECWRGASDGSCDSGDRVFGHVYAGELTTEQFS